MNLYTIKRISDGRFFISTNGLGTPFFCRSPCFWKTPDSVWINLKRLCSEYAPFKDWFGTSQKDWINFNPVLLKLYQVIVLEVDLVNVTAVPAVDFVVPDKLAELDAKTNPNARKPERIAL